MAPSEHHRRVVALAYDGLCTFEFGLAVEIFALPRPELEVPWYDFQVHAVDDGPLRAAGGVTIDASRDPALLARAGTVVVPGWRDPDETPPAALLEQLRCSHAEGARLLSICSGVFVLAAAGLLDGLRVTTHWRHAERLQARYPRIEVDPRVLYVDNGQILTSAGSAAGLDCLLHLVARDHGAAVANTVARRLVVPAHRDGGQAQFIEPPAAVDGGRRLHAVLAWAAGHLDQPLTVAQLADRAALSSRTFARHFRDALGTTPHRWLTTQRLAAARGLLETTAASIDDVAATTGFGSAENLRLHFRRHLGVAPTAYRRRFLASVRSEASTH